jgi:hypothetical protein
MSGEAKFDTWKEVSGRCPQCNWPWSFKGWDNSKKFLLLMAGGAARYCRLCKEAKKQGEYRVPCHACGTQLRGSLEEVRRFIPTYGEVLCRECCAGFFGRYDPENPALLDVRAAISARTKPRSALARFSDEQQLLYRQELRYSATVRRMSRANLQRYADILNPKGHKLGRSGVPGAYQLDHIVPISLCWDYRVPEDRASAVRNLQVVPWFVNLSRGGNMRLESLIGWPHPRKQRGRDGVVA